MRRLHTLAVSVAILLAGCASQGTPSFAEPYLGSLSKTTDTLPNEAHCETGLGGAGQPDDGVVDISRDECIVRL
jgi:hypothetical protein